MQEINSLSYWDELSFGANLIRQDQNSHLFQIQSSNHQLIRQFFDDPFQATNQAQQNFDPIQTSEPTNTTSQSQQSNLQMKKQIGKKSKKDKLHKKGVGKTALKNFLNTAKKCLIRLYKEKLQKISDPQIKKFLGRPNKTNRKEFEQLFNNQNAQQFLCEMFMDNELEREIQISRIEKQNRSLFINEINILKKAFVQGKLPNL